MNPPCQCKCDGQNLCSGTQIFHWLVCTNCFAIVCYDCSQDCMICGQYFCHQCSYVMNPPIARSRMCLGCIQLYRRRFPPL